MPVSVLVNFRQKFKGNVELLVLPLSWNWSKTYETCGYYFKEGGILLIDPELKAWKWNWNKPSLNIIIHNYHTKPYPEILPKVLYFPLIMQWSGLSYLSIHCLSNQVKQRNVEAAGA